MSSFMSRLFLFTPLVAFMAGVSAISPKQIGRRGTTRKKDSFHAMWAGNELQEEESLLLRSAPAHLKADIHLNASQEHVVLLGPMDSGTHLLDWMLEKNFPDEYPRACQGSPRGCRWVWKHSLGGDGIVKVLKSSIGANLKNTVVVAVVRSPFALLAAWRKDPWDMRNCAKRKYSHMSTPCSARIGATLPDDHTGYATDKVPKLYFSSIPDVIEQYYEQYASLQKSGWFKKVLVLRYEDLVLAPTAMITRLGSDLGWHQPMEVRMAKHGVKGEMWAQSGRQQAIENLRARAFMDEVPNKGLRAICSALGNISKTTLDTVRVSQAEGVDADVSLEPRYWSECDSTESNVA